MSEQNLLNYNLFRTNNSNLAYNFEFPNLIQPAQRRVTIAPTTSNYAATYDHNYANQYCLPPITPLINNNSLEISHQAEHEQLVMDKTALRSAILIKEKTNHNENIHYHHSTSPSDDQAPTHIVSPYAIREALKQEREEISGDNKRKSFSQYSSFHALKQRRLSCDHSPPPIPSVCIPYTPPRSNLSLKTDEDDDDVRETFDDPISPPLTHLKPEVKSNKISTFGQEKLKRPPNAYLLFNRDMRRKLLQQSPKMTVAEISKKVGDWWKQLPDNEREYYITEASILKEEHLKNYPDFIYTRRSKAELAEAKKSSKLGRKIKPTEVILPIHSEEEEEENAAEQSNRDAQKTVLFENSASVEQITPKKRSKKSTLAGGQKDPRGRKKKRHKHPFAPKHPMSAYLYYLASVYPQVSLSFPGSTVGPISKSISKTWHAMSPEEQLPWKQKAESDKARYAREMQVYMAKNDQEEQTRQEQLLLLQSNQIQQPLVYKTVVDDDQVDADVQTIAAVAHMVNNNHEVMYHNS